MSVSYALRLADWEGFVRTLRTAAVDWRRWRDAFEDALVEADLTFLWQVATRDANSGFVIWGGEFSSLLEEVLGLRALGVEADGFEDDEDEEEEEEEEERLFAR